MGSQSLKALPNADVKAAIEAAQERSAVPPSVRVTKSRTVSGRTFPHRSNASTRQRSITAVVSA